MEDSNSKKRVRGDSAESDLDSPMVKRLRDDLLDLLEDSDSLPVNQDLALVIKSFEEEILAASSTSNAKEPLLNPKSDSSEPQPDLVYLLEASDDDLGLPPPMATTTSSDEIRSEVTELLRLDTDSSGTGELLEFGDQIPNFDLFGFGIGDNYGGGHVTYGGLFEYPDVYYDSSEFSALLWRPETLSAE
ncbi:hypothetical protein ERO13_A13G054900v2 [Gossypium hirsutum]|uniref:Uncharacterized protein n=5 Tax=Gossypium TaxID=3633 RepID=A0A2P5XFV1_GOSBA|nr:uncharacterized protein LOC107894137 [Gossypium hirsutum]KAB2047605.1 hypothetical protein ES319_A13G058700v1 [Gossypium barbadense]TYG85499.1 hypothetical protein ES288_A13G059300v1 [Gossypium darwinii]TYH90633.1 hypothetical protein ES332_A13G062400v1 [Gossypium tomentosum]TYJ00041.1 hypothetical protein E1A91_A13G059900v1 [Gossypium mustelinum]KAG4165039.1 hypothetical protein ERO13_A13G054900v2 [Gossypium hirsutum]